MTDPKWKVYERFEEYTEETCERLNLTWRRWCCNSCGAILRNASPCETVILGKILSDLEHHQEYCGSPWPPGLS